MDFPRELLFPSKVIFKKGGIADLPVQVLSYGKKGMLVHGTSFAGSDVFKTLKEKFGETPAVLWYGRESREPDLEELEIVLEKARSHGAEWIAGIGGGSVLDLAKAVAGLYHASQPPVYYQHGGKLEKTGIPFWAVPTTAGTGSEATANSVIGNPERMNKLSIRDPSFMAEGIILDALLLKNLPGSVMAYSAMDALVQGYEAYISKNATWFSDTLALKAVELVSGHLLAVTKTRSEDGLEALLLGSFFAGVALSAARLGVIHGIAHPLGFLYHVPHGLVCSVCLPASVKLNREAMGNKYEILSCAVGKDFALRAEEMMRELGIVSPFWGRPVRERERIIAETLGSGSTAANPKTITREDVEFLLAEIFG